MATKEATIDYVARGPFVEFHKRGQTRAVLVCHRRAGKTVACVHDLLFKAIATRKPNGSYGYIAPLKNQAKTIAWEYLLRAVEPLGKAVKINNQDLSVKVPSACGSTSTIRLFGADDPDAFRGLYFDGVILDEYGDMKPELYTQIIKPALMDRNGWVAFIGTPKGHNNFYKLRELARQDSKKYFYLELKASTSGLLPADALAEARVEMPESEYMQEFECSFEAAIKGSYYAEQLSKLDSNGRMMDVPWIPELPVHMAWDFGFSDATSIWFFQIMLGEVRIIDFFEISRTPLADIDAILKLKPYKYGHLYAPHDVTHTSLQTGRSLLESLWDAGYDVRPIPKLSIASGLNAVRKILPLCWFDQNKCHTGLEHLRLYQKTWNAKLGIYTEQPRHDEHSHAADAFRYLSISIRDNELAGTDKIPQGKSAVQLELPKDGSGQLQMFYYLPPPDPSSKRKVSRV